MNLKTGGVIADSEVLFIVRVLHKELVANPGQEPAIIDWYSHCDDE